MIILPISDLHGKLPNIDKEFDLMLICGDVCPAYCHGKMFQKDWLFNEFSDWINGLPFKDEYSKVIMVFGNHDFYGEIMDNDEYDLFDEKTDFRVEILQHESAIFQNKEGMVSLFGTSYCKIFGGWAYMIDNKSLNEKFSEIPENLDILISHDSPTTNKLGAILEGMWYNEDTGNEILSKHIERANPKLFFSGHFHSGNHNFEKIGDTWMANVSIVNENYEFANKLLYVDYNPVEQTVVNFEYV